MADPEPKEPDLLLEFKPAKAFKSRSPDFWPQVRKPIKGLPPCVGLKIGQPYFNGHGFGGDSLFVSRESQTFRSCGSANGKKATVAKPIEQLSS
jgi:hypothetical protein